MFKFTNVISENVWKDRYSKNGESLEHNFDRVAKFCSADNQDDFVMFKKVLDEGLFFPGGRTMSNAGIGKDLTLNNCFVAPQVEDSMDDIFTKVKLGAITHQRGGGIGYDFSQIRPKGSPTSNDAFASGPISFIEVFNQQTVTITQGGRRGANMGVLSVYHMDIEDFITCKSQDANKLQFFNLSVMVDDDFMKAKNNDEDIYLHHPVYDDKGNILKDESKWKYKKKISAKYLWDLITKNAYDNGEPGVFFYNNMNNDNNLWYMEKIICSNPCAEYLAGTVFGKHPKSDRPLNPTDFGGACNLGSLMMHNFVLNPFTNKATVDYAKLKETIYTGVRLLDNIIDINNYPDKIFKNYQKNFRTIGLGITGFADMLTMLNLKYGTQDSIKFSDELMNFIAKNVYKASIELAKEKGPFPLLDREKYVQSGFIQKHVKKDAEWKEIIEDIKTYGIRNAKMISVAPTGTMSLTYGNNCSSGLEPIFSLSYDRKVKIGGQDEKNIKIVHMEDFAYGLWRTVTEGNIVNHDVFVTALDLPVSAHLEMLKTINFHVDMSSSKTINIPSDYSFEDTKSVYDYCWENGIKGCTIFRPNEIRKGVLIENAEKEKEINKENITTTEEYVDYKAELKRGDILSTDDTLIGRKKKLITGCGSLHLTAFFDPVDGEFQELFLQKGSDGGCNNFMIALSRMTSLCARAGVDIYSIVDQLKSCGVCPSYAVRKATKGDTSIGSCCPVAVGNAILELYNEVQEEIQYNEEEEMIEHAYSVEEKIEKEINNVCNENKENHIIREVAATKEETSKKKEAQLAKCPECGEPGLIFEGGCCICKNCGYSKCG
ncbi:MAG: adenosylcobalamin-dependent ribonucleoside-diphosphate reductase [Clostridiales bacterium]|nr:adenosylcobalamin-dependent ribonucleoside-diphosphate reductase [Clostridiales bacterium]